MMSSFLAFGFLQKALISGVLIATTCAILGVFLVLRKEAMVGHGFSHLAFAGVALGLWLNLLPLASALLVSAGAVFIMVKVKEKAGLYGDTVIGIISSLGMASGIIMASLGRGFGAEMMGFLFGDILAISRAEVVLTAVLSLIVIALVAVNYPSLLFMTFDRESALAAGIKVRKMDYLLVFVTATSVVLGMKIVGILLISALLIIPAATGLQLAASFKSALLFSVLTALFAVVGGLVLSIKLNIPSSAAVIIVSLIVFSLTFLWKKRPFSLKQK